MEKQYHAGESEERNDSPTERVKSSDWTRLLVAALIVAVVNAGFIYVMWHKQRESEMVDMKIDIIADLSRTTQEFKRLSWQRLPFEIALEH